MPQNAAERLRREVNQVPEEIRQMAITKSLETLLEDFCDSLALLIDLNNEAVGQR